MAVHKGTEADCERDKEAVSVFIYLSWKKDKADNSLPKTILLWSTDLDHNRASTSNTRIIGISDTCTSSENVATSYANNNQGWTEYVLQTVDIVAARLW